MTTYLITERVAQSLLFTINDLLVRMTSQPFVCVWCWLTRELDRILLVWKLAMKHPSMSLLIFLRQYQKLSSYIGILNQTWVHPCLYMSFRNEASRRNVQFDLNVADCPRMVIGDAKKIRTLVANLTANAGTHIEVESGTSFLNSVF